MKKILALLGLCLLIAVLVQPIRSASIDQDVGYSVTIADNMLCPEVIYALSPAYQSPAVVYLGDRHDYPAQVSAISYTNAGWSDQNLYNLSQLKSILQPGYEMYLNISYYVNKRQANRYGSWTDLYRLDIGEAFVFKTNC